MLRKGYLASFLEDCFTLNCTLKLTCRSQEKKRTLRVKNCLYFDVELFLELMTNIVRSNRETANIYRKVKTC